MMNEFSKLTSELSVVAREESERAKNEILLDMGLRQFRKEIVGLTQGMVAETLSVSQPEVSKLESRRDMLISTLRDYCAAVGAELHIVMAYGGVKVRLMLPESIKPVELQAELRAQTVD
jgi:predicted XRE-type DNA-binding protein